MQRKYKIVAGAGALLVLCTASALFYQFSGGAAQPRKVSIARETNAVTVFLPAGQEKLKKKIVELQPDMSERGMAELILQELKQQKCIPPRLKLHELAIGEDGVLYLNVSKELLEGPASTVQEITTVYGLANSFIVSFKDVRKVQLLIEGQPIYTLKGLLYIYEPLEFNKDLLED